MPPSPVTPATFCTPIDGFATTLTLGHAPGGPTITVAGVSGLGSPSPTAPVRLTAFRGPDPSLAATYAKTHYKVTGATGNVLTVAPADGYSDIALVAGDLVYCNVSAGTLADVHAAVLANTVAVNAVVAVAAAIPAGGSTGMVLAKASGSDYATQWASAGSGAVTSVAGRTGAVTLGEADVASLTSDLAAKAPLASPSLTGTPTAPTASPGTSTTQVATTAFVAAAVGSGGGGAVTSVAGRTGAVVLSTSDVSGLSSALSAKAATLVPTPIKSADYDASGRDFVTVDCSVGPVTVTLPDTPADGTVIGVKLIAAASSNVAHVAASGSDVFNKAGGSVALTLSVANQGYLVQYHAGVWYVVAGNLSLAQLDARYATPASVATSISALGLGTASTHPATDFDASGAAAAVNSAAVHLTGAETVAGVKTFTSAIVGSITGNAATATNGVVTTGSYADPAWVTSLAGSKISGNIAGNAAGLSASIAESQVTGLVSDLAAKAPAAGSRAIQTVGLPLAIQDSGGVTRDTFDASGYGLIVPFIWSLGIGSAMTTGADKTNWLPVPYDCKLAKAQVAAKTAPTGASLILDVLRSTDGGSTFTSLWATTAANRPTLASSSRTASGTSFDTANLTAGDLLRVDVAQVGSTAAGQDVTLRLTTLARNT